MRCLDKNRPGHAHAGPRAELSVWTVWSAGQVLVLSSVMDGWWAVLEHGATHVSIQHAVNSTGFTMWLNTSLCAPSVINPMHQDPQMKEQEQTLERNRHSERAKYHQGPNQAMPCSAPPPGRLVL